MIENKTLVSIIIPTFNRPFYLIRAVKSVIEQSYKNWECIIVDDNSPISAKDTLKDLITLDQRISIIKNERTKFASESRNIGISNSKGNYIAFLDDDDYWQKDKLKLQLKYMEEFNYKISYSWSYIINRNNKITVREPQLEGNIFDLMLSGQPLCNCSTVIVEKQILEKIGGFNKYLKRGNDGDLLRRLSQFYKIGLVKKKLVFYQVNTQGTNISQNNEVGIKRSLKSYKYRLKFFNKEIKSRPIVYSHICLEISKCYAKLGILNMATIYLSESLKIRIKYFLSSINNYLRIILLITLIPFFKIKKLFYNFKN